MSKNDVSAGPSVAMDEKSVAASMSALNQTPGKPSASLRQLSTMSKRSLTAVQSSNRSLAKLNNDGVRQSKSSMARLTGNDVKQSTSKLATQKSKVSLNKLDKNSSRNSLTGKSKESLSGRSKQSLAKSKGSEEGALKQNLSKAKSKGSLSSLRSSRPSLSSKSKLQIASDINLETLAEHVDRELAAGNHVEPVTSKIVEDDKATRIQESARVRSRLPVLSNVTTLKELALKLIIERFATKYTLKKIPMKYRALVLPQVKLDDLSFTVLAQTVPDNDIITSEFWKRMCHFYFLPHQCAMQGSGWKQTFFETFTKLFLEAQQLPEKIDESHPIVKLLEPGTPFVSKVTLDHLTPSGYEGPLDEETLIQINFIPKAIKVVGKKDSPEETVQRKIKMIEEFQKAARSAKTDGPLSHGNLGNILKHYKNLKYLSICFKVLEQGFGFRWNLDGMSLKDVKSLQPVFESCRSLDTLILSSNGISDRVCSILCQAISDSQATIRHIDLSHNHISDEGAEWISRYLLTSNSQAASTTDAAKDQPSTTYNEIITVHALESYLEIFNLSFNKLSDTGLRHLCLALSHNRNLLQLSLSMNSSITDRGATHLFTALKENFTLQRLNVEGCHIHSEASKVLADLILYHGRIYTFLRNERDGIQSASNTTGTGSHFDHDDDDSDRQSSDSRSATSMSMKLRLKRGGNSSLTKSSTPSTSNITAKLKRNTSPAKKAPPSPSKQAGQTLRRISGSTSQKLSSEHGSAASLADMESPGRQGTPASMHGPGTPDQSTFSIQDAMGTMTVNVSQMTQARAVMAKTNSLGLIEIHLGCNPIDDFSASVWYDQIKWNPCLRVLNLRDTHVSESLVNSVEQALADREHDNIHHWT